MPLANNMKINRIITRFIFDRWLIPKLVQSFNDYGLDLEIGVDIDIQTNKKSDGYNRNLIFFTNILKNVSKGK